MCLFLSLHGRLRLDFLVSFYRAHARVVEVSSLAQKKKPVLATQAVSSVPRQFQDMKRCLLAADISCYSLNSICHSSSGIFVIRAMFLGSGYFFYFLWNCLSPFASALPIQLSYRVFCCLFSSQFKYSWRQLFRQTSSKFCQRQLADWNQPKTLKYFERIIFLFSLIHLNMVPRPSFMCVYTPLWRLGAESVQEEWDVIVRGLGAQGITFLVTLYTAGRVQAGP